METEAPLDVTRALAELLERDLGASAAGGGCPGGYSAFLSGPVRHFRSLYIDRGWGCGWRNIQMITSYALDVEEAAAGTSRDDSAVRDIPSGGSLSSRLFGGMGFVPDIGEIYPVAQQIWT